MRSREGGLVGKGIEAAGPHRAFAGGEQAEGDAQRRGLARAVGADETEHLAPSDLEAHLLGGHDGAVPPGHPVEAHQDVGRVRAAAH